MSDGNIKAIVAWMALNDGYDETTVTSTMISLSCDVHEYNSEGYVAVVMKMLASIR